MIIDAHTHIGYWHNSILAIKRDLLKSMRDNNIDIALFSMDSTEFFENKDSNPITISLSQIEISNIALSFAKRHSNLRLLIWLKPYHQHSDKDLKEMDEFIIKNRKYIYGLKFHPFLSHTKISSKYATKYFSLARKHNLPICVHTAKDKYSDIKYLVSAAKKNKDINFIAAHLQLCSNNKDGIKALKEVDNIYGDTAWVNISITNELINLGLEDKIMFGTDNPIDGLFTYKKDIYQDYFNNKMNFDKDSYNKLMFLNAIRIYKLK